MKKNAFFFLLLMVLGITAAVSAQNYSVGDIITLGHYEQDADRSDGREVIEWRILEIKDDRALVISQYGLAAKPYDVDWGGTWDVSTLRSWLNNEFFNDAFSSEEQQLIPLVSVYSWNEPGESEPQLRTEDHIFLLSPEEAEKYFASDEDRQTRSTASVENMSGSYRAWWLRSLGKKFYEYGSYAYVDGSGEIYTNEMYPNYGGLVRPAFWMDITKYTGPSEDHKMTLTDTPEQNEAVGKLILFGKYEQDNNTANGPEPIIWQVLTVKDGRALVISRLSLEVMAFDEGDLFFKISQRHDRITWETTPVRAWLNDDFYKNAFTYANTALTKSERSRIILVRNETPDNPEYGTKGGAPTDDYVFLLSLDEVMQYMESASARMSGATKHAEAVSSKEYYDTGTTTWMLRTPGLSSFICKVYNDTGNISMYGGNGGESAHGIRPAMWMDIDGLELHDDLSEMEKAVLADGRKIANCWMKTYLNPGDHAEVAINTGLKLRKTPSGQETGVQAFAGKDVKILNGPVCENGVVWVEIDFLGYRGWCMEGKDGTYYLRKVYDTSAAQGSSANTQKTPVPADKGGSSAGKPGYPTLLPGDTVEIVNIPSLQMYMNPNRNPIDSVVAFPGKTAKITDGPQFENNVYWYEINFLGYSGWVMGMSVSGTYYLEKTN